MADMRIIRIDKDSRLKYGARGNAVSAQMDFVCIVPQGFTGSSSEVIDAVLSHARENYEKNVNGAWTYENLCRTSTEPLEKCGADGYRVRINYGVSSGAYPSADNTDEFSVSYSLSTERSLVTVPISTVSHRGAPHPGCIDPDETGHPRGVEIDSGLLVRTETHTFTNSKFSSAYQHTLVELRNHFNSKPFRHFAAGEVLFSNFSASQKGGRYNPWVVQFVFLIRANEMNINCGADKNGNIIYMDKQGWDYLWVSTGNVKVEGSTSSYPSIESRTLGAYVDRIYQPADFGLLKIGTR